MSIMTEQHFEMTTRKISDIVVGTRHRKDMGDLDGLAASMAELGLLHPIVVRPDGVLVAGERRLRAAQLLGWETIRVTVVDVAAIARGELAENEVRKDFTLSESVAIKRALEPLEKVAAKERQAARGGKGRIASGKLPTAITGRAADKAAKATGMTRRTLEKAEANRRRRRGRAREVWQAVGADGRHRARERRLSAAEDREAGGTDSEGAVAAAGKRAISRYRDRSAMAIREARRGPFARGGAPLSQHER